MNRFVLQLLAAAGEQAAKAAWEYAVNYEAEYGAQARHGFHYPMKPCIDRAFSRASKLGSMAAQVRMAYE